MKRGEQVNMRTLGELKVLPGGWVDGDMKIGVGAERSIEDTLSLMDSGVSILNFSTTRQELGLLRSVAGFQL